jgi:hypothetical protein
MDAQDPICLECIGDGELQRLLREEATRAICASCGSRRAAVPLADVADRVDVVYREYYCPGGESAHFDRDSDNPHYEQEGEEPEQIVQEIAGVEPDVAETIVTYLHSGEGHDIADGGDAYYESTSRYIPRDLHPTELHLAWEEFCRRVKHVRRFFDDEGRAILSTILGNQEGTKYRDNPLSVCVVALKTGERCYRARRVATMDEVDRIARDPRRLLGPPPAHLTPAGRMNPAGIPVFYGGFSQDVCIAEVRPHVGGLVILGEFRTARHLRLLDLTRLDEHGFAGSMFRSDFYERVTKRAFLRSFHNLISRPIQPHEEVLEYLPTQAVAEYIGNVLGLDGIIYESSQTGAENDENKISDRSRQNLVLLNRSARVRGSCRANPPSKGLAPILEETSVADDRRPSLRFVNGSTQVVRITAIRVSHDREFLPIERRPNRRRTKIKAAMEVHT